MSIRFTPLHLLGSERFPFLGTGTNWPSCRTKQYKMTGDDDSHREGDSQVYIYAGDQQNMNPRGLKGTWSQDKGGKGRRTNTGHGSGIRHAA